MSFSARQQIVVAISIGLSIIALGVASSAALAQDSKSPKPAATSPEQQKPAPAQAKFHSVFNGDKDADNPEAKDFEDLVAAYKKYLDAKANGTKNEEYKAYMNWIDKRRAYIVGWSDALYPSKYNDKNENASDNQWRIDTGKVDRAVEKRAKEEPPPQKSAAGKEVKKAQHRQELSEDSPLYLDSHPAHVRTGPTTQSSKSRVSHGYGVRDQGHEDAAEQSPQHHNDMPDTDIPGVPTGMPGIPH